VVPFYAFIWRFCLLRGSDSADLALGFLSLLTAGLVYVTVIAFSIIMFLGYCN